MKPKIVFWLTYISGLGMHLSGMQTCKHETLCEKNIELITDTFRDEAETHPAKMAPISEMNHSAELKPRMPTPW